MERDLTQQRKQAHSLLDILPDEKIAVVRSLLEVMVEPLSRTLGNAPYDDEPVSQNEAHEIATSRESLIRSKGVSNEEILAEFGLSTEDFERMGRTPLEPDVPSR
jgi:hypothetical protein